MSNSAAPRWLIVAPFLFLAFWSGGFIFAKIGLAHAEPLTLLAVRFALVVVSMAVLCVVIRPPFPKTRAGWVNLAIVGVIMQAVYFGLVYIAFDLKMTAGTVAIIFSLQPILMGIIAPRLLGERVGLNRWIGLVMGLAGVVIVIGARLEIAAPSLVGLVATLCALAAFIVATLWENRFGETHHPVAANLIGFTAATLAIAPAALIFESNVVDWAAWELWGALGYLVICNSLIATTVLLAMIRYGEVSRVSALFFLIPPCSSLLAWAALDEIMPILAWPGMALSMVGVLIATRAR